MIELKEYCGYTFSPGLTKTPGALKRLTEDSNLIIPNDTLLADIEGIHSAPFATRNYTRYSRQCLKDSAAFWTQPYNRPLIKHHNETDGTIIGRILNAEYRDHSSQLPEAACLLFTAMIPREPEASDVRSGLLSTVSIGVIAHDVRCSICGQNIAEDGPCEHERGQLYDGEICYWDVLAMEPKELSYVIVPSDSYAKNVKVYSSTPKVQQAIGESLRESHIYSLGGTMDEKEKQALLDQLDAVKKDLAEQQDKQAALETELQEARKALTDKTTEAETAATKLQEALDKQKEDAETIAGLQSQVKDLEEKQKAAEDQAVSVQEAYRNVLCRNLNFARKMSGRPELSESVLKDRADSSLQDSYDDILTELSEAKKEDVKPEPVKDPTLPNLEEKANQGEHKDNKFEPRKPIDLQKALADAFAYSATKRL